jgi:hypothetical protein
MLSQSDDLSEVEITQLRISLLLAQWNSDL